MSDLTGKTHFTIGTSMTILLTRPDDWKAFLLCLGTAAVGSSVCDVDVSSSGSHKGLTQTLLLLTAAVVVVTILESMFHVGIWNMIQQDNNLMRMLAGFAMFLCICMFGENQPHRSFMHSLCGVAAVSAAVFVMMPQAVSYMACSMLTHIVLDLFNRKKVQLLYPFSFGKVCFRLCSANGKVSRALFWIGLALLVIEIVVMLFVAGKELVAAYLPL